LDINVGRLYLTVVVVEFEPTHRALPVRHAHRAVQDEQGNDSYKRLEVWNPPIVMRIRKGTSEETISKLKSEIPLLFDQVLAKEEIYLDWTTKYFPSEDEDFPCTILQWIGKYHNPNLAEHAILKTGLTLLWLEYLLINKFAVPHHAVATLESNIEALRPTGSEGRILDIIPDTINRYLKAIIVSMAIDTAQKITEYLHDQLLKMAVVGQSQTLKTANTDISLCLIFILMIFLGRTQTSLLLLSDTPAEETEIHYPFEVAKQKIVEMDDAVAEYWISLHKYTLGRRAGGGKSNKVVVAGKGGGGGGGNGKDRDNEKQKEKQKQIYSAAEIHAREFGLVKEMRADIECEYGMFLPFH
jgi:hypothetical protein